MIFPAIWINCHRIVPIVFFSQLFGNKNTFDAINRLYASIPIPNHTAFASNDPHGIYDKLNPFFTSLL